jgi:P27 family predicted phage terminase small subunit
MGGKGFAPAPTKVKLLRGETRPSRVNYREPLPSAKLPAMPADMSPAAKVIWKRIVATSAKGVIRASHTDTLRCLCEAIADSNEAARLYAQTGPLVRGFARESARASEDQSKDEGKQGPLVKNPLWQIVRESREQVRLYAREFGLSPSAQSGLSVEPEHAPNQVDNDLGLPPRLRAVGNGD